MSAKVSESEDPVFVFTDPGIDDALALAMLSGSSKLHMIGACGVDGNVPSRTATANLVWLLELFGRRHVPVFRSTVDDPQHDYPTHVHGKNGLGDIRLVRPRKKSPEKTPSDFFGRLEKNIQLLSLGPLTAVAEILSLREIRNRVARCVIMGGGLKKGNETPYAEFNIHSNPDAANEVFRSPVPKILIPLDVTERVRLYAEDLRTFKKRKRAKDRAIASMLEYYFDFQKESTGFYGGYMHDPSAVLAITNPGLFRFRRAVVRVDVTKEKTRGRTIARYSREGNTWIAVDVDEQRARSEIMRRLSKS